MKKNSKVQPKANTEGVAQLWNWAKSLINFAASHWPGLQHWISDKAGTYWPTWRQWIGGTLVATLGGVSFWVSPIKDRLFHQIWNERVKIQAGTAYRIYEGDSISVPISLLATGGIGFASGFLRVAADTDDLILDWTTKSVPGSEDGVQQFALKVEAKRPTKTNLTFDFENRYGLAKPTTINVEASRIGESTRVAQSNFSGRWNLRIGDDQGQMTILEKDSEIMGLITMRGKNNWPMHGLRDGSTFEVTVENGDDTRLVVKGNHSTNAATGFIEINAVARPQGRQTSAWLDQGGRLEFYATARLRANP